MTDLSDSTALCNQLNFHDNEEENNEKEIFIGNLSQNSTPNDTPMNNSINLQNDKESKRSNEEEEEDNNVEYNDTIDEYIKTTKKKPPQTKANASAKKQKGASNTVRKNSSAMKPSSSSLKKSTLAKTKPKSKSIKPSHSAVSSTSRSSNFTKNLPHSNASLKHNASSKKQNGKAPSTTMQTKVSKNAVNSNNNNNHKRTQSATSINKEGTITSHSNNTITKKEDILPSNASLHFPTTEQAQTNEGNEQGLTQLIFSKDESNDVSTISGQRAPARRRTRRDSYKHSIMVVQEKLLKKEEEKGESNKISFNDNEHQIRRKRNTLGDFKDIDENATKQPPKLRKSSRKFTALRPNSKAVNKQSQNEETNATYNDNNKISDTNDVNDDKRTAFDCYEHSPIMEEKHEYGSTERKKKQKETTDKFMSLFNEVKHKLQTEKEKHRQLKLKKSSSTPLYNTKSKSIYSTKANDNINTKRQLLSDLLKQNTRNNPHTDRHSNEEDLKRSADLKSKFKQLKRNDHNINGSHNKVSSFTNSALLLQLKHQYNKKYLLDNGVVSSSEENEKEGESNYKTFEELKSKAFGTGLSLNKLSINKSLGIFGMNNDNDDMSNIKKTNKNKSTKARNIHYKGLSLSQILLCSFLDENGNCDLTAKVCPPNAMEKSKFNYFVE